MVINKKAKDLYNLMFDGAETWFANMISSLMEWRFLKKYLTKEPIPKAYKKQYKEYWKKYKKVSPRWGWYYASRNGVYDPRYIPNTLYYSKIDQHFNDRKLGWGFNDKNYYSLIFSGVKQPEIVIRKINSLLYDENYILLTLEKAIKKIEAETEIVCKPALETGSGRGIRFWEPKRDEREIYDFLLDKTQKDFVVQKVIRQHKELNKIHDSSVNTIRICSLLMEDGVHILSSCLRMGVNNSRIDNVTSGGISAGIDKNGMLHKYAYTYYSGEKMDAHPQGFVYEGFTVPSYDRAIDLVKICHPIIAHFRLVSWDIAIDEGGDPILIEANMRKGGINLHQFDNGPLFGELTDKVLDEVFSVKG